MPSLTHCHFTSLPSDSDRLKLFLLTKASTIHFLCSNQFPYPAPCTLVFLVSSISSIFVMNPMSALSPAIVVEADVYGMSIVEVAQDAEYGEDEAPDGAPFIPRTLTTPRTAASVPRSVCNITRSPGRTSSQRESMLMAVVDLSLIHI